MSKWKLGAIMAVVIGAVIVADAPKAEARIFPLFGRRFIDGGGNIVRVPGSLGRLVGVRTRVNGFPVNRFGFHRGFVRVNAPFVNVGVGRRFVNVNAPFVNVGVGRSFVPVRSQFIPVNSGFGYSSFRQPVFFNSGIRSRIIVNSGGCGFFY